MYFSLLLLTLNVPLQKGKCRPTTRGTCTPGWEPLIYSSSSSKPIFW